MTAPVLLLDACTLYPAPVRDLLMRLAVHELIRVKWTDKIHEEWINAVLRERPDLTRAQLERTRQLMNQHGGDCLVESYEARMGSLTLPDPDDRHVLAAAIESQADAIITWNLKDFPNEVLSEHGIEVWTPDELVLRLLGTEGDRVVAVMAEHRRCLKHPPRSAAEYLAKFEQQRMIDSARQLRDRLHEL